MFLLKVFGGASLEGPDGPLSGPPAQRHRLAILALLATAPNQTLSRDKVLGYLWPESETERARRSLNVSLHALRKALGEEAILSAGDNLRLDLAVVRCDAAQFEDTLSQGKPEAAVALYAGPFLDGFFLSDAADFERCATAQRERLAGMYAEALEELAERAKGRGDLREAVGWWRRLAAHDPYSGRVAQRLMEALAAAGDRAGALYHARVHAALVDEEYSTDPDREVQDYAERLRREAASVPRVVPEQAPSAEPDRSEPAAAPVPPGTDTVAATAPPLGPHPRPAGGRPPRHALRAAWLLGGATVFSLLFVLGTSGTWTEWQNRPPAAAVDSTRVAVLPFSVRGSVAREPLGEEMAVLLSSGLDGAGDLRAVDHRALLSFASRQRLGGTDPAHGDAVARRFGAGLFVLGDVVLDADGDVRITAGLYRQGGRPEQLAGADVRGPAGQLFDLVDRLTIQLLAARTGEPASRRALAAMGLRSPEALKAYLEGERHLRAGRFDLAIDALERANLADSTFALANYRLSLALEWGGRGFNSDQTSPAERAVRHAGNLPERERTLLEALLAWRRGDAARAEFLYSQILRLYPEDVEGWLQMGEVLFHYAPLRSRPVDESAPAWSRVLRLEPGNRSALVHLTRVAAITGRRDQVEWAARQVLPATPDDPRAVEIAMLHALTTGDLRAEAEAMQLLRGLPDDAAVQLLQYTIAFSNNLPGSFRVAGALTEPRYPENVRGAAHVLRAHTAAAMGRWREAERELSAASSVDRVGGLVHRVLLAVHPLAPPRNSELRALRAELHQWDPDRVSGWGAFVTHPALYPMVRSYLLGLVSARLADAPAAEEYAKTLAAHQGTGPVTEMALDLAAGVRAEAELASGQPAGALRQLERLRLDGIPFGMVMSAPIRARARERHLLGEVLYQVGRDEEALSKLVGSEGVPLEIAYVAPAHLRQAQIHERLGSHGEAAEHYARFVELWRDCDPELRPQVDRARQRLAALRGRE